MGQAIESSRFVFAALCDQCSIRKHQLKTAEKFKLYECVDYSLLEPKASKQTRLNKKLKLGEIIHKVSALRNSTGGVLFIHLNGISYENRQMGLFSEYVDVHLNELIEDGSSFVTEFSKQWYSDSKSDLGFDYIVLTVTGSSSVSTADFKTKIALDDCIIRPSSHNMNKQMFDSKEDSVSSVTSLWPSVREECRNVQFKSIQPLIWKKTPDQIVHYIWQQLRLPEYITSFSKLQTGGSFFIGVSELGHARKNGIRMEGVPLTHQDQGNFHRSVKEKIKKEIVYFSFNRSLRPLDPRNIHVAFHPVGENTFVIEIAVASVSGCVFYDTSGPETYVMNEHGRMVRMKFEEWLWAFERRKLCTNCTNSLCERCKPLFS